MDTTDDFMPQQDNAGMSNLHIVKSTTQSMDTFLVPDGAGAESKQGLLLPHKQNDGNPTALQHLDVMLALADAWAILARASQRNIARAVDEVGYKLFGSWRWAEVSAKTYMGSIPEKRCLSGRAQGLDGQTVGRDEVYTDAHRAQGSGRLAIEEALEILDELEEKMAAAYVREMVHAQQWL